MSKSTRTVYSEEFKIEAIKLVLEGGTTVPEGSVIFGVLFEGFLCFPHYIESWHESCGYGKILSSSV